MTADILDVRYGQRLVGKLRSSPTGALAFAYDGQWLRDPTAFAVSLSLPRRSGEHTDAAHAFFANLLPEGSIRGFVARRLGVSEGNDYALLRAVGGDCAGALTIVPEGEAPPPVGSVHGQPPYIPIATDELEALCRAPSALSRVIGRAGVRLSLAGAQDKLPVYIDADGRVFLPTAGNPSSHIIKFPSRDFKHLPANETFTTMVASQMGLPTVQISLRCDLRVPICVVRRYDRARSADGALIRLHQEDACQALGVSHSRKYEQEGGPTLADCFCLVRDHSSDPLTDTRAVLRWFIFNTLVGNADAHAKNLSMLRWAGGELHLAPHYDLVCTRVYPGIDRRLAMTVGGVSDPGQVGCKQWAALARQLGVKPTLLLNLLQDMGSALPEAIGRASTIFRERFGDSPVVDMIAPKIRRQTRRLLRMSAV